MEKTLALELRESEIMPAVTLNIPMPQGAAVPAQTAGPQAAPQATAAPQTALAQTE